MGFDHVKLEKGMYRESGKTFTQVLESLDPSENYRGTALEGTDAFQRQLKRFDIKGKEYLRTLGKYYIVDIGLRNYLLGFRNRDSGHAIENVVYFELLRRGYDVAIGKIGNAEVDFIATTADDKKYIQVTESMVSEEVRTRELAPLRNIRDNYEKFVLSMETGLDTSYDGIKSLSLIDWLLDD